MDDHITAPNAAKARELNAEIRGEMAFSAPIEDAYEKYMRLQREKYPTILRRTTPRPEPAPLTRRAYRAIRNSGFVLLAGLVYGTLTVPPGWYAGMATISWVVGPAFLYAMAMTEVPE